MSQDREFYRVDLNKKMMITLIKTKDASSIDVIHQKYRVDFGDSFEAEIMDLSAGGMKVKGARKLDPNQDALFALPLDNENMTIQGVVKVCEESQNLGEYLYRVHFITKGLSAEHKVMKYLNSLQSREMNEKDIDAYDHGDTTSITDQIILKHGERRKKTDAFKLWPPMANFIGWGLLLFIAVCVFAARPLAKDPISQLMGARVRLVWDIELLYKAYFSSMFLGVFSFVSMMVDLSRQNRKDDYKQKSLFIQFIIALSLLLYFILALDLGKRGLFK